MARRKSGRKIDFTHWTGFSGVSLGQAAGSVGFALLPALHDPETLLRTRGEYVAWLDGAPAVGDAVLVSLGIILVPEGTAATVLWSPFTDADAPWIWYDNATLAYEEPVTDVIDIPLMTAVRRVIDNKAMRVVRNQELQFVIENTTIGTAQGINVSMAGRFLLGT